MRYLKLSKKKIQKEENEIKVIQPKMTPVAVLKKIMVVNHLFLKLKKKRIKVNQTNGKLGHGPSLLRGSHAQNLQRDCLIQDHPHVSVPIQSRLENVLVQSRLEDVLDLDHQEGVLFLQDDAPILLVVVVLPIMHLHTDGVQSGL